MSAPLLILQAISVAGRDYAPGDIAAFSPGDTDFLFVRGAARRATQAEQAGAREGEAAAAVPATEQAVARRAGRTRTAA